MAEAFDTNVSRLDRSISTSEWIAIATLLRPQGRRGELLAEPLTDLPEIFVADREVAVVPKGAAVPVAGLPMRKIEESWEPTGKNAGRIVLKLSGCDSIHDAEALAGRQLLLPAAELPRLDADTFFVGDLVGCAFFDGDERVGTIVEVQFATGPDGRTRLEDAAPLLGVETTAGEEPVLVPFVRAWLMGVDIAARRVTMQLPAGLMGKLEEPVGDEEDGDEEDGDE